MSSLTKLKTLFKKEKNIKISKTYTLNLKYNDVINRDKLEDIFNILINNNFEVIDNTWESIYIVLNIIEKDKFDIKLDYNNEDEKYKNYITDLFGQNMDHLFEYEVKYE